MSRLWMVAYDIEDDRSRRRVHDLLKDYGERVQYSVFECWLKDETQAELRNRLVAEVEEGDSIRWYPLCVWCRSEVVWQGRGTPADDPGFYLL